MSGHRRERSNELAHRRRSGRSTGPGLEQPAGGSIHNQLIPVRNDADLDHTRAVLHGVRDGVKTGAAIGRRKRNMSWQRFLEGNWAVEVGVGWSRRSGGFDPGGSR